MNSHRIRGSPVLISRALVLIDLATLAMTLLGVDGPGRFVLGLIFALTTPGWSIIGMLKLKNPPLEVALSVAASLSIVMVAAQIMASVTGLWHPVALEEILCGACLPPLLWRARDFNHKPAHAK